jgi:lysophospholipase L1-like esterase
MPRLCRSIGNTRLSMDAAGEICRDHPRTGYSCQNFLKMTAVWATQILLLSGIAMPAAALEANREGGTSAPAATNMAANDASSVSKVRGGTAAVSSTRILPKTQHRSFKSPPGLSILQIGDSHTAADYFTGEVRRILQARYGDGGPGYLVVGTPHPGIRHAVIKSSLSAGWTYSTLQKSSAGAHFSVSGFNATASAARETVSLSTESATPYDFIEIETWSGPGRGAIEVALDKVACIQEQLGSDSDARIILRIVPSECRRRQFKELTITTTENGAVTLDGIGLFEKASGLTYSNVGFPGATIDIINKFDPEILTDELKRRAPQIVVLAFGTNEGFKDDIDLDEYRAQFVKAIHRIRTALPNVRLVMILPPDAARLTSHCAADAAKAPCESNLKQPLAEDTAKEICIWRRPPQLDRIRDIERAIAQQEQITYWDWSKLMPADCGAHIWSTERHFMTRDHVHFTQDGYRFSAGEFAKFLRPIINSMKLRKATTTRN